MLRCSNDARPIALDLNIYNVDAKQPPLDGYANAPIPQHGRN